MAYLLARWALASSERPSQRGQHITGAWRHVLAGLALMLLGPAAMAQNEAEGHKLYLQRGCASCHGADPGTNTFGIRSGANNPARILAECAAEATMVPSCSAGAPFEVTPADAANIAAYIANPNSRGPAVASVPGTLRFQRAVGTGASPRRSVTLANTTGGTIVLSSLTLQADGLDAADYVLLPTAAGTSCVEGLRLAPQASCGVDIVFAPSVTGTRTASLLFFVPTFDTVRVPLNGIGTTAASPAAAADIVTLDFGAQPLNASSARTLQVTNVGDADLNFDATNALTLAGPQADEYTIIGGTCTTGATVARDGGNCTVQVRFAPKNTTGNRVATLQAGAKDSTAIVTLRGAGLDPADDNAGGCSMARPGAPLDPMLPALGAAALAVLAWRRRQHRLKHPHARQHRS